MKTPLTLKILQGFGLFALLALVAAFTVYAAPAHATWNNNDDPQAEADANARSDADAHAGAAAGAIAGANAEGGDGGAGGHGSAQAGATAVNLGGTTLKNDGVTSNNTTNNESNFFSFNSSIPAAGKCFGAAQGGGGGGSGGGFLGFNWLNNDCWMNALAEEERSVEVRARLKCGSKKFRNAIAFDKPRKERQRSCIAFMIDTYVEQLEYEREQVQAMLDAQTLVLSDHVTTETERTTDTLTRVVETCTDCYGANAK